VIGERYGRNCVVIPNCYDEENTLWAVRKKRETVNIGWIGTATHREDFELAREPLLQILSECKEAKIVIGLDPKIYEMFKEIPENRKMFIPALPYQEYPSFYAYTDIMLAPLLDTYFARAKSDIKLVEAGAASQPFVASALPFYTDWCNITPYSPGLIADEPDMWYAQLKRLVDTKIVRVTKGAQNHINAQTRTSEKTSRLWDQLLRSL
jgi:hypothetical protein